MDALDRKRRTVDVKKGPQQREDHPEWLFAHTNRNPSVMEKAIDRLAQAVIADGGVFTASGKQNPVAASLLLARAPKLRSGPFERLATEDAVGFAVRAVRDMEGGVLAIQGPPGAGKTFAGATIIRDLVKQGKKVGVMATSHRVVLNLLKAVLDLSPPEPIANVLAASHAASRVVLLGRVARCEERRRPMSIRPCFARAASPRVTWPFTQRRARAGSGHDAGI